MWLHSLPVPAPLIAHVPSNLFLAEWSVLYFVLIVAAVVFLFTLVVWCACCCHIRRWANCSVRNREEGCIGRNTYIHTCTCTNCAQANNCMCLSTKMWPIVSAFLMLWPYSLVIETVVWSCVKCLTTCHSTSVASTYNHLRTLHWISCCRRRVKRKRRIKYALLNNHDEGNEDRGVGHSMKTSKSECQSQLNAYTTYIRTSMAVCS